MGDPKLNLSPTKPPLHLRGPHPPVHRTAARHSRHGRKALHMDDPAALRLLHELPDRKVLAGAEQDDGDGSDRGGGIGVPRALQLAPDFEAQLGVGRCRGRAERVVVAHCGRTAGVHFWRIVRENVDRVFLEGVS